MTKMRKVLAVGLAAAMALAAAGCSGPGSGKETTAQTTEKAPESAAEKTEAAEGKDEAAEEKTEAADNGKKKVIAFVPKQLGNPYFVAIRDAMEEAAVEAGYDFKCNAPDASTEVDKQVSIAEAFVEANVDALVLGPCDKTAIVDVINKADSKGIPVFLVDSGADESNYVTYIGTDNFEGGKIAAKWFGENVKGQVAIVDGAAGNDATTQRYKGFMEVIAEYPDVEVVTSDYANGDLSQGMTVAENFLTAYPNLAGIFAVDDMMAIGAGQAVEAANKKEQVKVCGFDGQPDAAQKVLEGTIDVTIAQKPATMGRMVVDAIEKYMAGEDVERVINTGCDVVDEKNAETYLEWQ